MPGNAFVKNRLVEHSRSSSIISTFIEEFEGIFTSKEAKWDKVKIVFSWLKEEAKNARYFSDINAIDKCRRISESFFSRVEKMEIKVRSESKEVNNELRKRFDELRVVRKGTKRKLFSVLTYEHEHDKVPPSR